MRGAEHGLVASGTPVTASIELHDDGVGITADGSNGRDTAGCGVGLANTRERLRHLYGDAHRPN